MPDDRMIHRRMLRGDRIAALTDFERGIWLAYQLIADDFGVMRLSAVDIQKAVWLEKKPRKSVQRGFEAVVAAGLMHTFTDGERIQVYQRDWNTWQKVRHPRATIEPCPPVEELRKCDATTQALFKQHARCPAEFIRENSGKVSEIVPQDSGLTRGRALAEANGNGNGSERGLGKTIPERAGAFVEWYEDTHQRLLGVAYIGTQKDWTSALQLVEKLTDQEVRDAAIVWFGHDDDFATNGTRTIPKFASRATGCLQQARARGIA